MKKFSLLAFVLALLTMIVTSEATVLVFKGTGTRFKGDNTTSSKVSTTVYFVIQYDNVGGTAGQNYFVFTSAAKKTVALNGPRSFGFAQVGTAAAKTNFYVHGGGTYANVFSFAGTYVRFQGLPGALQPLAANPATVPFIKSLSGTFSDVDSTALAFQFPTLTLAFDKVRTQAANALGKNAATLGADIANEFLAKPGYVMGS